MIELFISVFEFSVTEYTKKFPDNRDILVSSHLKMKNLAVPGWLG